MTPPPTLFEKPSHMQLHDISEAPERPYHHPTPKETLFRLTERISNDNLKQAIQKELTNLITEYDQFISVLHQRSDVLEQEYENFQSTEESYQRRYEKAVREMQFFKKKYDKLAGYQELPISPLPSSTSSDSSYQPPQHLPPLPPPTFQLTRTSSSSTNSSNASNSLNPVINDLSPAPLPRRDIEPKMIRKPSASEPTLTRSTTATTNKTSVIQQRKVDPLTFGGSDSFWETIAKSSDSASEKMISNFLRRGGSPNTAKQSSSYKSIKYGYGLIHTVIVLRATQALELLLSQGANPNTLTLSQLEEDKVTPGYLAAQVGWLHGLDMLVEAGADLSLARGAGIKNKTCLHVASENCHTTAVEYIVQHTSPHFHLQVDSMGANALHYAAISGHTDLMSFLIQRCQLPVDLMDIRGETALHWASRSGHLEAASFLIEKCGADFNSYVSKKSSTPFDLAKHGNHKRLLDYYKKIGALSTKKMEKKKEEEEHVHLQSVAQKLIHMSII